MCKGKHSLFLIFLLHFIVVFLMASSLSAQYWYAMPPYNVLWPLWPDLSASTDSVNGIRTPVITSLTSTTQLPSMPAFIWDVGPLNTWSKPYFLYNAPVSLGGGLYMWDQITGFSTFPPPAYLLADGTIYVNPLPVDYEYLIPGLGFNNFDWLTILANNEYISFFAGVPDALGYFSLLTGAEIWGVAPPGFPDVIIF
ncbi:MAG: hypothetical protein ACMUJM_13010 [bacterium]